MLRLKMLLLPMPLQPKKLHLLKTPWLLKKLLLQPTKQPLTLQPPKLLLQTKLLHLQKPLPSKLARSDIPFGELEEGQPGNRLALFFHLPGTNVCGRG